VVFFKNDIAALYPKLCKSVNLIVLIDNIRVACLPGMSDLDKYVGNLFAKVVFTFKYFCFSLARSRASGRP
jgi:hypothetical protein